MLDLQYKNEIKLIATDFDGILTDGGLYVSCEGSGNYKKVNYKDIMGISLWIKSGGKFAIISGDKSASIDFVAQKFSLDDVYQGLHFDQKDEVLLGIMEKYSLKPEEVCYVGDDVNDINALKSVKTRVTVSDANFKVKGIDGIIVSEINGGHGVIREIVDTILN